MNVTELFKERFGKKNKVKPVLRPLPEVNGLVDSLRAFFGKEYALECNFCGIAMQAVCYESTTTHTADDGTVYSLPPEVYRLSVSGGSIHTDFYTEIWQACPECGWVARRRR
jgi:hypothetical protein